MNTSFRTACLLVALAFVIPGVAFGYGGPGSVISGIGALLAAVTALLASLFGFIWFPLKRLYHSMAEEDDSNEQMGTES